MKEKKTNTRLSVHSLAMLAGLTRDIYDEELEALYAEARLLKIQLEELEYKHREGRRWARKASHSGIQDPMTLYFSAKRELVNYARNRLISLKDENNWHHTVAYRFAIDSLAKNLIKKPRGRGRPKLPPLQDRIIQASLGVKDRDLDALARLERTKAAFIELVKSDHATDETLLNKMLKEFGKDSNSIKFIVINDHFGGQPPDKRDHHFQNHYKQFANRVAKGRLIRKLTQTNSASVTK